MRSLGAVAIPPKGTKARALLEKQHKEKETPELRKIVEKMWHKAQAIITGQQLNGAGHEIDRILRWFQWEYNDRIWRHDLHSLPSTYNIVEAFLRYDPPINAFILHEENNHLFSLSDFVDWYTSEDTIVDPKEALEYIEPGVTYTFDSLFDPADLLYGIEKGNEVGISGFALVRFGTEISILCVAGESVNLEEKNQEIKEQISGCEPLEGRKGIAPHPDLTPEAVPLESKLPLWKLIALIRFDLNDMSQSVRYICHDAGISYLITTDDPAPFLNIDGQFFEKDLEEVARKNAQTIGDYNALFDLCSTFIFLPLYFEKFAENIFVERFRTNYANEVSKLSFRNTKKAIPNYLRLPYRNVNVLRNREEFLNLPSTIYSIPNFHMQTSGYWRTLEPGKIGADRKGGPIHGRTWVSKKITWMEADEPSSLVAKRNHQNTLPDGSAPGFIYVMKSPLQPKNVFKVGLTRRTTQERADELSGSSGLPGKIYVMHEWPVGDCVSAEREIHEQLSEFRVDPRREFFEAPLDFIVSVIEKTINKQSPTEHSS